MNNKLPDPTRRPLTPQAPSAPLGPKPPSPPQPPTNGLPPTPNTDVFTAKPNPTQVVQQETPPSPPPAPPAPPTPVSQDSQTTTPPVSGPQQPGGFSALNKPVTRPLSPPPAPPTPPTPPSPDTLQPPSDQPVVEPKITPAPPTPVFQNSSQTPPPTPSLSPPPATPPSPPQENPGFKQDQASPSDVKKSPFRLLIPLVVIILLLVVGFAAFTYFSRPKQTNSINPQTQTPATSQAKPLGKQTEIIYWGLWEPSSVLDNVFAEFETSHPGVTIKYTQQSPKDYRERLQSALARGDGPDIFRFHNTWIPMLNKELDSLPESVMGVSEYQSTFYPVMSSDLRSSKSFYGIPFMFDGLGLYYNKKILENAGKVPPKTWEELRNLATELTIKNQGTIQRSGVALGTSGNVDNYSDILGLMMLQNGADPANPTTSLASDALTFYTIFSTIDGVWDDTLPASTFAFATEKAVMIIAPSWRAHEIREINPELDFAIAPVPQLPSSNITWASYWVEGVAASSKNKQASWELIDYLSSKEVMRKLYTEASNERLFGEPFSRVDMAEQLLTDPYVGAYISGAPDSQSWYLSSRTFDNGLNDRIIKYYEDAINAVNSGKDSSTALQTTSQGVTQVISQYSSSK